MLAAINALGANQRDLTTRVGGSRAGRGPPRHGRGHRAGHQLPVRSLEDGMAEMKDLLVRALDR